MPSEAAGQEPRFAAVPAAASDRRRAAHLLASAFSADPHFVGLLPVAGRERRLLALFDMLVEETLAAGGHAWLATDIDSDEILGAALWDAPGAAMGKTAQLIAAGRYLRVFGARVVDAVRTDRVAHAHRPRLPHWYLKAVGTAPAARGRGIASALMGHRLAVADSTGTGTYLESSTAANVPFYRRHGFMERSHMSVPGTTPLVGMWRPAANDSLQEMKPWPQ